MPQLGLQINANHQYREEEQTHMTTHKMNRRENNKQIYHLFLPQTRVDQIANQGQQFKQSTEQDATRKWPHAGSCEKWNPSNLVPVTVTSLWTLA